MARLDYKPLRSSPELSSRGGTKTKLEKAEEIEPAKWANMF